MMENIQKKKKNLILLIFLWMIQGIVVGFGAIVPGLSGGALLAAFGMHKPIVELMSDIKNIKTTLKKYGLMLAFVVIGLAIGFVGLAGVIDRLIEINEMLVVCVFMGFVLGTVPDIWKGAGEQGRGKKAYISASVAFAVMMGLLIFLGTLKEGALDMPENFWGYALCGVFWALSFIVPGLSSSTLIIYIGLYGAMNKGISTLNFSVLIPMGIAFLASILLLAKPIGFAYKKQYSVVSHSVLGIVLATAIMMYFRLDLSNVGFVDTLVNILFILGGAVLSYLFTYICNKIKEKNGI